MTTDTKIILGVAAAALLFCGATNLMDKMRGRKLRPTIDEDMARAALRAEGGR